jgi:hypothetical protein
MPAASHVGRRDVRHQRFLKRGIRQLAHVAIQIDSHKKRRIWPLMNADKRG